MATELTFNPFELPFRNRFLARAGEALLGLAPLIRRYAQRPPALDVDAFLDYTLQSLGVQVRVESEGLLDSVPRSGPVLVVANHPLGGLEGVAIARMLLKVRPDLQVLTKPVTDAHPRTV